MPATGPIPPRSYGSAPDTWKLFTLLFALFFMDRRIRASACFALYGMAAAALLLSIFYRPVFPDCFVPEGGGLTAFKIASEYVICLLLFVSALLFVHQRQASERRVLFLFLGAIAAKNRNRTRRSWRRFLKNQAWGLSLCRSGQASWADIC